MLNAGGGSLGPRALLDVDVTAIRYIGKACIACIALIQSESQASTRRSLRVGRLVLKGRKLEVRISNSACLAWFSGTRRRLRGFVLARFHMRARGRKRY